jgi:hypothetical protein
LLEQLSLYQCATHLGNALQDLSLLTELKTLELFEVSGCWNEAFTSVSLLTQTKELMIENRGEAEAILHITT